jgi:hypothetical protein
MSISERILKCFIIHFPRASQSQKESKQTERVMAKAKFSASQDAKLCSQRPIPVYRHGHRASLGFDVAVDYLFEVERVSSRTHLEIENSIVPTNSIVASMPSHRIVLDSYWLDYLEIYVTTAGSHSDTVRIAIDLLSQTSEYVSLPSVER